MVKKYWVIWGVNFDDHMKVVYFDKAQEVFKLSDLNKLLDEFEYNHKIDSPELKDEEFMLLCSDKEWKKLRGELK